MTSGACLRAGSERTSGKGETAAPLDTVGEGLAKPTVKTQQARHPSASQFGRRGEPLYNGWWEARLAQPRRGLALERV